MIVISILFFIYLVTITVFTHTFDNVKEFNNNDKKKHTEFTVIIPFRNESENLPKLLTSISNIDYPTTLVDFLFVNDDSTDDYIELIHKLRNKTKHHIRVIENKRASNSPKKDAITTAINTNCKEWIATTDADCELPKNWLKAINQFIQQENPNMLVCPVAYSSKNNFLNQFQLLDFLSLQASTISGFGLKQPFLCNGANLIYKKELFKDVKGFNNNNSIASGDDIFLLEKFLKIDKRKVRYLKSNDAIVFTSPEKSWKELINQRTRWASKTSNYTLFFGKIIGLIVIIGNGIIAFSPLLYFLNLLSITSLISYFFMKLFFDFLLIERVSTFYKQRVSFINYCLSSIFYPYFTILIFIKSIFGSYQWKGRTFKK